MNTESEQKLSLRDDSTQKMIRSLFLEGHKIKEIQAILGINPATWDTYYYDDLHGFRQFMRECKKERFLILTEQASEEFMAIAKDSDSKKLAIKQKEAEFLRETLLKEEGYTKRVEVDQRSVNLNEPLDKEQLARLQALIAKRRAKTVKTEDNTEKTA